MTANVKSYTGSTESGSAPTSGMSWSYVATREARERDVHAYSR